MKCLASFFGNHDYIGAAFKKAVNLLLRDPACADDDAFATFEFQENRKETGHVIPRLHEECVPRAGRVRPPERIRLKGTNGVPQPNDAQRTSAGFRHRYARWCTG